MAPPYVVKPIDQGSSVGVHIVREGDNYRPTAEGLAWFARVRPGISDSEDALADGLSAAERAELLRLLRRLLGIDHREGTPC